MEGSTTVEINQEGAILSIALNRPEVHNALNGQLIAELTSAFKKIPEYQSARIVVLTGKGRTFCAGADLSAMKGVESQDSDQNLFDGQAIFDMLLTLDECPLPVVCRMNGAAIGGGVGLISCCDIVIAVERAKFGFSEVRLGLVPAVISPFVIPKIGVARALELFLTGERFNAGFAKEVGLVQHVVAEDELDAKVNERVQQLLQGAPGAQTDAKKLVETVRDKPKTEMRGYTTALFNRRWNSNEGREGMRAYLEKRKPNWQD